MRKKIKLRKEARIGIFTVAMIFILYWGINFIKGTDLFRGTNTYYALYDQVGGLQISSQVVIQGYKVGVIRSMNFDPQESGRIAVELGIKSKFKIPVNSKARVFSDGLMGGKAIEIVLGDSGQYLNSGDTLYSELDKDILELAGSEFEYIKQKANVIINELTATLKNVNALLEQNTDNVTTTMDNLARMSGTLSNVLSAESEQLKSIIDNMNALSHTLKESGPKVDRIMANMESFTDSLRTSDISNAVDELTATLSQLNTALGTINDGKGTAGKMLTDEQLYDSLAEAASNLSLLLEDLKANPGRYVHFSLFGGGKK